MTEVAVGSDKALGVGLALAVITLLGAVVMYGAPAQMDRAWGFALAVIAALVSVSAFHVFE